MSQFRSLGRWIPRSCVRISSGLIRRIRLRRRWPRPEHFARMSPAQIESYIRSIGFDQDVRDALAEYEGDSNQARLGSGVPNSQGGPGKR